MDSTFNDKLVELSRLFKNQPSLTQQTGASLIKSLQIEMQQAIRDNQLLQASLASISTQLAEIKSLVSHKDLRQIIKEVLEENSGSSKVKFQITDEEQAGPSKRAKTDDAVTTEVSPSFESMFDFLKAKIPPPSDFSETTTPSRPLKNPFSGLKRVDSSDDEEEDDEPKTKKSRGSVRITALQKRRLLFDTATKGKAKYAKFEDKIVNKPMSQGVITSVLSELGPPVDVSWPDLEIAMAITDDFTEKLRIARGLCIGSATSHTQGVVTMLVTLGPRISNI